MLMQMGSEWESLMSQATALDSEARAARKAYNSAADAVWQAKRAFAAADADPDRKLKLHRKIEEAVEDESKKKARYQEIQERLAKHRADRRAMIESLCTPSEPSAPLFYQRLAECH